MTARTRLALVIGTAALAAATVPTAAVQQRPDATSRALPDFDIRARSAPAVPTESAAAELRRAGVDRRQRARVHPDTGAVRVLDAPDLSVQRNAPPSAVLHLVAGAAERLGLEADDIRSLELARDYVSASTGLRHVVFSQSLDGIPVFGAVLAVHIDGGGGVARITSSVTPARGRRASVAIPSSQAAAIAAADIRPEAGFVPAITEARGGATQAVRFARGAFARDIAAGLTWFPMQGTARLTWRVEVEPVGEPQLYDVLIDAETGELLYRRNRVLYTDGNGRVPQSVTTAAIDPRRPDQMPVGAGGCPPPVNFAVRSLNGPFRDPSTVLFNTGRLVGNNTQVFHLNTSTPSQMGSFDGTQWSFDFGFNTAGSAQTALFFALNYAHDFFYDLGFDEASGNFQADNFGRGGVGGDSIKGVARASGRNNATFQPEPEGTSPIISMFLWDGAGCWAQDVDGDGALDMDGDYDLDIVLHEFHHGVSHRLNTAFTGSEADAIGEGGSDFFAYSVNGDTTLAEYSWQGGLRGVNSKNYADWFCFFGIICEPHDNGEIWANVLWDVRERFRTDLVGGSEAAAINESHQLYVDGLKLSPPAPTMLDMRDAMVLADALRNPGSPNSENFCRIWESFAGRGMGLNARDTIDNGFNQVTAGYSVPEGCTAPPGPPTINVTVVSATANEAGPVNGTFRISRSSTSSSAVTIGYTISGSALNGTDYTTLPTSATIPAGAAFVDVQVAPVDDTLVESNETVVLTLQPSGGIVLGSPTTGTVTIVSDDVAPDMTVSTLTVPLNGGAGTTLQVTDTTRNQGTGASTQSVTQFYLSQNYSFDASDPLVGSRTVPPLAAGASDLATTSLTLPSPLTPGIYMIFAKADGPGELYETSEINNVRSGFVRIGPDLAITALTAPSYAGAGLPILVSDTTKNQGGGAAEASVTRFYLSTDYQLDGGDTPLQSRNVPALAADGSSNGMTSVTIPANAGVGLYYLIAKADATDAVPEWTEGNNTRYTFIRVGPDLAVGSISVPSRGAPGGTITVTETTRNAGAGAAGPSTTAFYLSTNYQFDGADLRLSPARSIGALGPSGASIGSTVVTLPAVTPGMYFLIARADDLEVIAETTETNNTWYTTILIGPDLTTSSISGPFTALAGTTITVSDTARNSGSGTAGASTTRYFLSTNTVWDAADIVLDGERAVPALATGATSTGSVVVTVPADLAAGIYYLMAVADATGVVPEASETNNSTWRQIIVNR